jgi:hypothetical protein
MARAFRKRVPHGRAEDEMKFGAIAIMGVGLAAGFAGVAPPAAAQQLSNWDGTWAGNWESGQGTQIVFAGNELIAVYWRGDYISQTHAALSHGGASVAVQWNAGEAVLTRDGPTIAHIVIHEKGRPEASLQVKKDN